MNLRELQQCWQEAMLANQPQQVTQLIASPPRDSAATRAGIYTEGYLARLLNVLEMTFPALQQWLGEENFYRLGETYLRAYPSHYFSVVQVGRDLATFLARATIPEFNHPAYSEMAALEWTIDRTLDKGDAVLLKQTDLLNITPAQWPEIRLIAHPSLSILPLQTNVLSLYQAWQQAEAFPAAALGTPQAVKIWRKDYQVHYAVLTVPEQVFLQLVLQQQRFAEICEKLCEYMSETEVAPFVMQQLGRAVEEGLLTGANP